MILRSFFRILPRQSKRAMFLTSLYFYLVKEGMFRNITLRQFSKVAKIDMSGAGMQLPLASKDLIWDKTNVLSLVQEEYSHCPINTPTQCPDWETARKLSERVVDSSPSWLSYERDLMIKDTIRLFYH